MPYVENNKGIFKEAINHLFLFFNQLYVFCKDAGFVYEAFRNKSSNLGFLFSRNKSMKRIFHKQVYETNPQNKSMKRIFWNQYGFVNPKPWICMDLGLFKVRLCAKDLSGFVRICCIRENRLNLLKISLQNKSMKQIFWKH